MTKIGPIPEFLALEFSKNVAQRCRGKLKRSRKNNTWSRRAVERNGLERFILELFVLVIESLLIGQAPVSGIVAMT